MKRERPKKQSKPVMERQTHVFDATDQSLGRLASEIAKILMGKHRPDYLSHQDKGDKAMVENLDKMKWTGKKMEQKKYYSHSGYPGHLKVKKLEDLWQKNPQEVLKHAVYHMLPKNRLRKARMKRLKIK